jgi:AraC-like DNA-binding protein
MIQTVDLFEICSRVEQSTQPKEGLKSRVPSTALARTANHQKSEATAGRLQFEAADRIGKAFTYMMEHLNKPIHISALGRIAGMSSSTFYVLFKTATGYTPNEFFTRARMHRACVLLQGKKLRIKEVAALLGYDDQFYFSRVFKSVSAVAPVHYRRLNSILQHEIKELLDPKLQTVFGESLQRLELGRLVVDGHSDQSFPAPQKQPETKQLNNKTQWNQ